MTDRMMRRGAAIALAVVAAACQQHGPAKQPADRVLHVDSSGGEVSQFSLMQNAVGWLTDSNVVSLAATVNEAPMSLARAESQAWTDDQTHQYAMMVLRDHAALQSSIDSLAAKHRLPSQTPAVAADFHARYDSAANSIAGLPAAQVDPKFVTAVIDLHERTLLDFGALAGNTLDPDLRALLAIRAVTMEQQHITRARQLAASIASADSAKAAAADSAKSAKRQRKP